MHEALITLAAQGRVIHNDDTTLRVQSQTRDADPTAERPERTRIFTTGLIAAVEDHTIALFVTGHRHAGENLEFMSLIRTCRLCAANPLDYLNELQRHAKEALEHPTRWLPWNYEQALSPSDTG